ncbi:hypothetical protein [Kitasatospora sp. NPDC001683]
MSVSTTGPAENRDPAETEEEWLDRMADEAEAERRDGSVGLEETAAMIRARWQ